MSSKISTEEYVPEGYDSDRNDRDCSERTGGVVHDIPRRYLLVVLVLTRIEDLINDEGALKPRSLREGQCRYAGHDKNIQSGAFVKSI